MIIYSLQHSVLVPDIVILKLNTGTNDIYIQYLYENTPQYSGKNNEYIVENNRLTTTDDEICIIFQTTDENEFNQYLENHKLIKNL